LPPSTRSPPSTWKASGWPAAARLTIEGDSIEIVDADGCGVDCWLIVQRGRLAVVDNLGVPWLPWRFDGRRL